MRTVLLQTVVSVALAATLAVTTLGGVGCLWAAEQMPASESARRLIAHATDFDPRAVPDAELLSERGQRLRRRGARLLRFAAVTFAVCLVFGLVVMGR